MQEESYELKENVNIENKPRIVWIDLLKIIACIGVLLIHTINYNLNTINLILYNLGLFSIPFFLIINGYLLLKKDNINYKYCFNKIIRILIVVIPFLILDYFYTSIKTHDFVNSLNVFYKWIIQKGLLSIYWYFAMLICMYLLLPLLKYIYSKDKLNLIFIIILLVANIGLNISSLILKAHLNSYVIQTFRFWIWILYFMLGGFIYKYSDLINNKIKLSIHIALAITLSIMSIILVFCLEKYYFINYKCENYYSYCVVIVSVLLIVLLLNRINIDKNKYIENMSSLTLGVYLIHIIFVHAFNLCLEKLEIEMSSMVAVIKFFVVLILSFLITFIISKIKYLNKLIRL